MNTLQIINIVLIIAVLVDMYFVFRRDLMMLQQNSYRNERYMRWFNTSGENTSVQRILAVIALLLLIVSNIPYAVGAIGATLLLAGNIVSLARAKYKKPLVVTNRVKRLWTVMAIIAVALSVVTGVAIGLSTGIVVAIATIAFSPAILLGANILLVPVEKGINNKYYNDAASRLAAMPDLKIIGITGSYGKTSTKHYLNRILSEKYDVLMTPGSFNTTLGVIRTIREHLKPYNEVFIVEMGAKQIGDIKEICDLVHPQMGIVTAVGEQHLESFKSIENVQRTKFELIDSLPHNGVGVVNNDFPNIANRKVDNVACVRYALNNTSDAQFSARDIVYDETGTNFTIIGEGKELRLHTRLVGECNISNLIAAVIIALRLNVPDEKIRYAVEKIEQVEHRLNLKRTPGGITIIDDAFNSNPTGSSMAMDVLSRFTKGKRIVITPGMIELGERQFELNEVLGAKISECADVAIIVGEYNREALLSGISNGKMASENVHAVSSFNEAQRVLATIAKAGDTVLYENDLPDTFK